MSSPTCCRSERAAGSARRRPLLLLALGLALVPVGSSADEDEEEHEGRRPAPAQPAPPPPATGVEAVYREECGSCHLAYPPGLLPAASWRRVLGGLSDHFGQSAELDTGTLGQLSAWLEAQAAERGTHSKSGKVLRSLGGASPLRLTEVPYLRHEHREVRPEVFRRKGVGARSNCPACHEGANRWDFDEDRVSIPRR